MCWCCTFLFWLHKVRKHSSLSVFQLLLSRFFLASRRCASFFFAKWAHGSEKNNEKMFNCVDIREKSGWSEIFILRFSHRSVRYTGECFMYIIIETRRSLLAARKKGLSRYKTIIIFYFSNQLIFKCRCMRNASLGRLCCVSDAWPAAVLVEGAQMRENINIQPEQFTCVCSFK